MTERVPLCFGNGGHPTSLTVDKILEACRLLKNRGRLLIVGSNAHYALCKQVFDWTQPVWRHGNLHEFMGLCIVIDTSRTDTAVMIADENEHVVIEVSEW